MARAPRKTPAKTVENIAVEIAALGLEGEALETALVEGVMSLLPEVEDRTEATWANAHEMLREAVAARKLADRVSEALDALNAETPGDGPEPAPPAPPNPKPTTRRKKAETPPAKVSCTGSQKNGEHCKMPVIRGLSHCFNHLTPEERTAKAMPEKATFTPGPRWPVGTFEAVEVTVMKGGRKVASGLEARVTFAKIGPDGKLTLVVEG
jgi:hypothetical protein